MRLFIICIMLLCGLGTNAQTDSLCQQNVSIPTGSYYTAKQEASLQRQKLARMYRTITESEKDVFLDSVGIVFEKLLVNSIFPYWQGTTWSFEGHTATPNQGEIACGYLVSTTLSHMGIKVNRYHMAQQNPVNEGKTLALGQEVVEMDGFLMKHRVESMAEGLYFVGLSNHVGYLWKREGKILFLHSNYSGSSQVMAEKIDCSGPYSWSSSFVIVPISTNRALMKKWLLGQIVQVVKS